MLITGATTDPENQPGTPQTLRAMNERILLEYLRHHGPHTRAQLARTTGLSKPTVSQALANLERTGLARPIGQIGSKRGGRQAILYEFDPTAGYVVGIDIGRAWVRVAIADLTGSIIKRSDTTNYAQSAEVLVTIATELAHNTVTEAGFSWSQVIHTVIGTPGVLAPSEESLQFAPNLPDWDKVGLVDMLRQALESTITVDNDANLAAIGERTFGCGRTVETFVFLMVGTGIGMGIVINGTLFRGAHGAAGEIGFLPLLQLQNGIGPSPRGILEEAAAAESIAREALALGMSAPLTAKQVFEAAHQGDQTAIAVVEQEGHKLALAIATITAVLDPEIVVLGGGVGSNVDLLRASIERRLSEITPIQTQIVGSELGEDGVLLGAIATALPVARNHVFKQHSQEKHISE